MRGGGLSWLSSRKCIIPTERWAEIFLQFIFVPELMWGESIFLLCYHLRSKLFP